MAGQESCKVAEVMTIENQNKQGRIKDRRKGWTEAIHGNGVPGSDQGILFPGFGVRREHTRRETSYRQEPVVN